MRGFQFFCFVALIALLGLAFAEDRPGPPARCLAKGECEAPAPACTSDEYMFVCDQKTGYWVSNYTFINITLTIGSPVLFTGNLTLNRTQLTWNASDDALLVVMGHANFSLANNTWIVNVDMDDLDDYAEVEKEGSKDYSKSRRPIVRAGSVELPSGFNIRLKQVAACHTVYLNTSNPTFNETAFKFNGTTDLMQGLDLYFYTKSACWKWAILVGCIIGYVVLLIAVIVAFRLIPGLKAWTRQPTFDSHSMGGFHTSPHVRRIDENSYELEGNFGARSNNGRAGFSSNDSDETDSVRLDI